MPLADGGTEPTRFAKVIKTEEKGTDVNLATHLLHDAHMNRYDAAVLISNDSDLTEPLRIVRRELNKMVGLINPRNSHPCQMLLKEANFVKRIRPGLLGHCLLPPILHDAQGEICKPAEW